MTRPATHASTINFQTNLLWFVVPAFTEIHLFKNSGRLDGQEGWAIFWLGFVLKHATGPSKIDPVANEELRQLKIKYLGHP